MNVNLLLTTLLVALLGSLVDSVPLRDEQQRCANSCNNDPQFISYETGKTYIYNYHSATGVDLSGSGVEPIDVKARVEISVHSPCELSLHLRDVRITGASNPDHLTLQLQANSLQFGFDDGKVVGVCPSIDDTPWTINVKKAIISALQMSTNTLKKETTLIETDISGECETVYSPKTRFLDDYIEIEKSKSLMKCTQKPHQLSGAIGLTELIKRNQNLIDSNIKCLQLIDNSILSSIKCEESQSLLPSMVNTNEPIVKSKISLDFVTQESRLTVERVEKFNSQDLTLNPIKPSISTLSDDSSRVLSLLTDICSQMENEFTPKITQKFTEVIATLKTQSKSTIKQIESMIVSEQICSTTNLKDLFIDASSLAMNEAASDTVINAIDNQEMSRVRALYMMTLIGFFSKPTEEEVKYVLPLLQSKSISNQEVLLISSVIHNFCEEREACDQIPIVSKTIDIMIETLEKNPKPIDMLYTLKALENIKVETHEMAIEILLSLAKNTIIQDEVRIASMNALINAMEERISEHLSKVFNDKTESAEVRITAYKTIVLSGYVTLQQLQKFRSESDPNVANYIRSHMNNLRKTLNNNILPENTPHFAESDNNLFITSSNLQFMYSGININLDIIYQKSLQIPQTVSMKTFIPVLGTELQLVDIVIRQKGFDHYFKNVLRKVGNNLPLIYKELLDLLTNENLIDSDINNFVQIMIKIEGKNILIFDTRDLSDKSRPGTSFIKQMLNYLSQNLSVDQSFGTMFLNSNTQLPTITGIPLNIDLNGTLVARINAYRNFAANQIETQISPSIMTELSVGLRLLTNNLESGVTVQSRIYSSPVIDHIFEIKNNRIFTARYHFPKEKQTLFKFETEVNSVDSNGNIKQIAQNSRKQNNYCSQMSKILGISLCTEISFTKPLITPNVDISLIKSDKSLKSFELAFEAPDETSSEKKSWKLSLNTPNSRINRKFSAEVQTINPLKGKKRVQIDINTPWNGMQALASFRNDQNIHEIKFHVKNNEETQLLFDVGLEKQIKQQSIEYKPQLKLKTWNSEKDELSLSGTISLENDEYTNEIDIDSYRVRRDVISENEIDSNPSIVSTNLNLKIFALDANIKASLDKSKKSADIVIEYNLEQLSKESVKLSAKVSKDTNEQISSKSVTLQLTLSQFPEYNAQLTYGKAYENNRLRDLEVELLWNERLKDKLHIRRSVKYIEGAHDFEGQSNWIIEYTPLEINYEVQFNGIHDNNEADNSRLYNVDISITDLNEKENILTGSMNVKAQKHILSDESSHRKIESSLTLSGPLIEDYPRFKKIDTQIEYTSRKQLQIKIKSPVRLLIGTITREVSDDNTVGLNAKITETKGSATRDLLNGRLRYQVQQNRAFVNELIVETNFKNTPQTLKINQKVDVDYDDDKKVDITILTSIESTRIPQLNAKFYYTLNAERRKHVADEFLLAWGKQLNNKINVKREVNMTNEDNFVEVTERATVIATPLDIDYVVNEHALVRIVSDGITNFQFHVSKKDRTGRHSDRDYSAGIDFERNLSSELASGSLNASLKYRKRDLHYRETWQLIGGTERKGHIYIQWEEGKYSNVDYSLLFERKQLKKKETQTTIDINIKRQRWYEEQPKEFRGTITRFIIADKEQLKFSLESNDGVTLKGDIIKKGDRSSRKEVSLTYDINLQCPQHLELKVAGKQRRVPKSHLSSDLSIDYKWKDNERQSIKAATRGQMVVSYTLINVTAKSELKCTQFPQYNYLFDWQTLYKLYQRFIQNELTVAWSEDFHDNRVHVYYENIDTNSERKLIVEMMINGAQKLILDAVIKNQSNERTLGLRSKLKLFWSLTEEINLFANFQLKNDTPIINVLLNDFDFSSELMLHFPHFEMMAKTIIYNSAKHKWSNISIEYKWPNMRKEFLKIDTKFDHLLPEVLPNVLFYGSVESSQFPNYCAEVIHNLKGNWSLFIETYTKLTWNNMLNESILSIATYSRENKSITETFHIFEHTIFIKVKRFNINYAVHSQLEIKTREKESIKLELRVKGEDRTGNTELDFTVKFSFLNEGLSMYKECEFLSKFCNGFANVSLVYMNRRIKFIQQWKRLSEKKDRLLQTILEWPINNFVNIDISYDEPLKLNDGDDDTALSINCKPLMVFKTHINEQSILMNGNVTLLC